MMENTTQPVGAAAHASVNQSSRQPNDDQKRLLARIKRAIRRNTSGGVQKLTVEMHLDSVRLRGQCSNFYCKQVAQQTAMGLLGDGAQLLNEIEVLSLPR